VLVSAHPSKILGLEGDEWRRGTFNSNLKGFAYHFYDREARWSMESEFIVDKPL